MEDYEVKLQEWLDNSYFNDKIKAQIRHLPTDERKECFYKYLEFGTGGMRGIMGPGINRMNIYTIRRATQGIANYIIKCKKQKMGVVVGYDTRNNSYLFAKETALCLNANGIKTYLFSEVSPTPLVSFAIRQLKTFMGINITASHNTKEYNGYKVYLQDGAQFSSPEDMMIINEIDKIVDFSECKTLTEKEADKKGLLYKVPDSIYKKYIDTVYSCVCNKKVHEKMKNKLRIVYTPLHGTGEKAMTEVIKKLGYKNYFIVKEQNDKCGDFKTVESPNPENASAFKLAFSLAKEKNADIIIATDPDADRLGVYVKHNNEYEPLTGNMLCSLMCEYLLHFNKKLYKNRKDNYNKYYIVKSFVTTNIMNFIAENYNVECKTCLTGFKWIGKEVLKNELLPANKRKEYLFGAEESYGALVKDYVRDKDGISAGLMAIEMCAFFKYGNLTLIDAIDLLYKQYGYNLCDLDSFVFPGIQGMQNINNIMNYLNNNIIENIDGIEVNTIENYNDLTVYDLKTKQKKSLQMDKSNAIIYKLVDGSTISVRPSGTEPKIKIYYQVLSDSAENSNYKISMFKKYIKKLIDEIK